MSWLAGSVIRRLVTLTLAAGLVTGLLGVLVVAELERRDVRDQAAARNVAAAQRIATLVDSRLAALESQLRLLASRGPISTLSGAETELAVALRVSDELDELILHDRTGRAVVASSSTRLLEAEAIPPRPDLVGSLQGAGSRVTVLRAGLPLPSFELVVPVEEPPGRLVGALVGRAPVALVIQDAETRALGVGRSAFVTEADGTIVAHPELERVLAAEVFPIPELFPDGVRTGVVDRDGEPVLVAGAPLEAMPGWVVIQQLEREALQPVESAAGDATGVFLAVVAAIVAAVVLAGHRLLRPLGPLAEAVERLGRGERGVRVDARGTGEVSVLADGFNRMATALDARQRDLEEAERAARDSEERLRLMVEGVEDYAIVLLGLDGRVRSWNTGARRLLGPAADDAVGRALASFYDGDDPPDDPLLAAATRGRGESEGWCRRDDGDRFWARIVATALRDEADEPYGFAVVIQDLTARQAAREAMQDALGREREAAEELRRTNQLKDEFLAVAAHEIRTPLSAILGASNVLSVDWDDLSDVDRVRFRDMIETHAQDMKDVVERLLDLTRLQAGRVKLVPEPVRIDRELERHVRSVAVQLDRHDVVVDAPPTTVTTDRDALRHVVTNLLTNAAKFSQPASRITVRAAAGPTGLTVEVADEGIGIDPGDQELIFELFRQSSGGDSTARGTGVGLAIVRRYVELLGGTVDVESAPGCGATFRIHLPDAPAGQPSRAGYGSGTPQG